MPHEKDQTHWHEPTGSRKAGYGEFKKQPTPYDAFMESEGIPVFRDIGIRKVQDLPLAPWKRTGGRGHFIQPKDDIEPDPVRGLAMRRTNFIPDVVDCDLPLDNRRSPGWRRVEPFMTGNCFYFWIGQHENGRYSKGHAHTSAAVLICVKGKGYTYTWPERLGVTPWKDGRAGEVKRVDYEPVGMVSAAPGGARWYHQHFSVSKDPFRLTAWFGPHNPGRDPGAPGEKHTDYTAIDIPDGGTSIPYWMEDPYIRREYGETMQKSGGPNRRDPGWYVAPGTRESGSGMSGEAGGRIFFSNVRRSLEVEDEIRLASVGVDIGSSTSHLVFSRLVLERLDNRYVVSERNIVHESEVLLTPYSDDAAIDAAALGRFIDRQYESAGNHPRAVDTGALHLTGGATPRGHP